MDTKNKTSYFNLKRKIILVIILVLSLLLILFNIYYNPSTERKQEDLRLSAITASHNFIKERLKYPDNVVFQSSKEAEYYIDKSSYENYHTVVSYFDAKTESGSMIRTNYNMTLQKTRTVWLMIDLKTW
jgi:hypothetical protein